MASKKEQRQRSIVTRYPGIFTDWSGTSLSGKLRDQITVGNIVRIPLEGIPLKRIPKEGIGNTHCYSIRSNPKKMGPL